MAFYELRQYKVQPGKMNEWLNIMEGEIIPFQVSKGMVICGSFRGETDDSVYVWIRRFESESQREALYQRAASCEGTSLGGRNVSEEQPSHSFRTLAFAQPEASFVTGQHLGASG